MHLTMQNNLSISLGSSTGSNYWIKEVDYWRGIAIIAVITIHCTGRLWWYQYLSAPNILSQITTLIYSCSQFAVPFFIFISGFVLCRRYEVPAEVKSFFLRRISFIIPPYVIFSLLYICFYIIIKDSTFNIKKVLFELLVADASFHLWYIAVIIQFYLLYPILIRIYNYYSNNIYYLFSIIFGIQILLPKIIKLLLCTVLSNYYPEIIISKILHICSTRLFVSYLLYFMLGIHCAKHYTFFYDAIKKISNIRIAFAALTILILSGLYSFLWLNELYKLYSLNLYFESLLYILSSTPMYLVAFLLAFRISYYLIKKGNAIQFIMHILGKYAFGIFLIHVMFIRIIAEGLQIISIHGDSWLFYPMLLGGTIISSVLSVYVINQWSYGRYIIGVVH